MVTKILQGLVLLLLLSCSAQTQQQPNHERPQAYMMELWISRVDVCKPDVRSCEKAKVLFLLTPTKIGIVLNDTERLVMTFHHVDERSKKTLFTTDYLQEHFAVDIQQSASGIIIFIIPVLTQDVSCHNRIFTTAYVFSFEKCHV